MALELEVNLVPFLAQKPYMCRGYNEKMEWTQEVKQSFYHQPLEVHLIKLGPLTEEFLTRKKIGWSKVDFGLAFEATSDGFYKWTSGPDLKGLPMHHVQILLDALKTIGYEADGSSEDRVIPVTKYIYRLEKKF